MHRSSRSEAHKTHPAWQPMAVRTIELSQPLQPLTDVADYDRVRVFAMWQDIPVGWFEVAGRETITPTVLAQEIAQLTWEQPQPIPQLNASVSVSIVIATCDRPEALGRCLQGVVAQNTTRLVEIIVVDNRPEIIGTVAVTRQFPAVKYLAETRPGGSFARNAGIRAATGAIIVTLDDDVTVPPDWLERLLAPLARSEVAVVTGNLLPLELETASQQIFEIYGNGGLGRGFTPFEVDRAWFDKFQAGVPTWELGATANVAFRAEIFRDPRVGLMDEVLGPGMPSGAGEDLYLFYRILRANYRLVYAPEAWGWHQHRRTLRQLRRQLFNYSKGNLGYHMTALLRDRDWRVLVTFVFLPVHYIKRLVQWLMGDRNYPLSLTLVEIAGFLAGPWGLWRSYWLIRRIGRSQWETTPRLEEQAI
jgi:O-antigen biosynthesis protein